MIKKMMIIGFAIIGLYVLIIPTSITPSRYFYLSKEEREHIIKKLSKNCLSSDITGLQFTYIEVFNDRDAAKCWREYFEKCLDNRDNNFTLMLPIVCPSY